jgi:hypothetical protein
MFTAVAAAEKKPWEWTAAERVAALRDPVKRQQRVRENAESLRRSGVSPRRVPNVADFLDGSRHPELYFPTQLFEHLVDMAFLGMPAGAYRTLSMQRSELFKNPKDWDRFVAITANYVRVLKQERGASPLQPAKCVAEARAFREARRTFGKARFDRMLYEVVAPTMTTSFSIDTDFKASIAGALAQEERCQ